MCCACVSLQNGIVEKLEECDTDIGEYYIECVGPPFTLGPSLPVPRQRDYIIVLLANKKTLLQVNSSLRLFCIGVEWWAVSQEEAESLAERGRRGVSYVAVSIQLLCG